MKYFIDGLPRKQIAVLKALGPHMIAQGFHLGEGTSLAIHLEHRISVDLDWFTAQPFDDSLLLAQSLRYSDVNMEIAQVSRGTLRGSIHNIAILDFLNQ